jgi:1-acyl-sn-glycerol-3-phosphate acyltransferase
MRLWRPYRRFRGMRHHGLSEVEVRGLEHVQEAMADGFGVLITPNHPSHADPFVLVEASERLGTPFYFMTAWQVFAMTHRLGRRVLRQHGAFSINREGHDLPAFRAAVGILQSQPHPLVVFPEGEVFHLNDRVMPFRRGAATMALRAAHRSGRPVAVIPCGMKFQFVDDPTPSLLAVIDRIERRLGGTPSSHLPIPRRLQRIASQVLSKIELERFGQVRSGPLRTRQAELLNRLLSRLEERHGCFPIGTVPERVKQVRRRVIAALEASTEKTASLRLQADLDEVFLVMQLFSYPSDYLLGRPSVERLAETLDKMEEDLLGVPTARRRGVRRAIVSFGEPIVVSPFAAGPGAARPLTDLLQNRVQTLVDEINAPASLPMTPAATLPSFGDHDVMTDEVATVSLAG